MKKIAIANLKGGVGKSTTTLFAAEHWALNGNRVLVIDLDPQSNASYMLLSRRRVEQLEKGRRTLPHLFEDSRNDTRQDASAYIVPRASDLVEISGLESPGFVSIVPTIPRLWFEEYDFDRSRYSTGQDPVEARFAILRDFLRDLDRLYDCVLMDCPPGFSTLTRSALGIADAVVAPTLADYTSLRSLRDFVEIGLGKTLGWSDPHRLVHVVVSKFTGTTAQREALDLLKRTYERVSPPIPQRDQVLAVTECLNDRTRTYSQKYRRPLHRPLAPFVRGMCDWLRGGIFRVGEQGA